MIKPGKYDIFALVFFPPLDDSMSRFLSIHPFVRQWLQTHLQNIKMTHLPISVTPSTLSMSIGETQAHAFLCVFSFIF